jgi:ADP-heptose:LPS heptosyltransferase
LLAPLLGRSGIEFHVLQKTIRAADAAVFQNLPNVHLHSVDLADLADTAALAAGMDLIISADTAEAHLAGAIGKPVWVLLGRAAHFAWMTDRQDTPWYPTARLFRQHTAGDWTSVAGMLRDAMWQRRPNIML